MKSHDRLLCEAIGRVRRRIEKLEKRIVNSMEFHETKGTEDPVKWQAMASDLLDLKDEDRKLTDDLRKYRSEKGKP